MSDTTSAILAAISAAPQLALRQRSWRADRPEGRRHANSGLPGRACKRDLALLSEFQHFPPSRMAVERVEIGILQNPRLHFVVGPLQHRLE